MTNKGDDIRQAVVRHYLRSGDSIRRTALKWHLCYTTVFRWVKTYRVHGEARLLYHYTRPWNRATDGLEEGVVMLKERDPTVTVRKAREVLKNEGTNISIKGIWGIWKRYGYAGFDKRRLDPDSTKYVSFGKEAERKYQHAEVSYKLGNEQVSATILNSIPMLPRNELLLKIPDSYLNLRRRIEKAALQYKKSPLPAYLIQVKSLYDECAKKNLLYSCLKVGIPEVGALSFLGKPGELLAKTKELEDILKPRGNYFSNLLFVFRFALLASRGIASANRLEIDKTSQVIRQCRALMKGRKDLPAEFMSLVGTLCTWIQDYKRAEYWFRKAIDRACEEDKYIFQNLLAITSWHKGDYRQETNIYKKFKRAIWGHEARKLSSKAIRSLVDGMPDDAISLSARSLELSRKEDLNEDIARNYFTIASAYNSLGNRAEARAYLRGSTSLPIKR